MLKEEHLSDTSGNEIQLQDIYREILKHIKETWSKRSGRRAEETARALLSIKRAYYQVQIINYYIPKIQGKKLLEIGSGYSIFLTVARLKFGIDAYGIEPANNGIYTNTFILGKKVLERAGIKKKVLYKGCGERIPFPNQSFDVVYSYYVFEHTNMHNKILKESMRVLKKGGYLIFVMPNYHSFWEGHYGVFWWPFLNKPLAKIYIKLLGKDPSIIDELNFVSQEYLEKIIVKISNLKILSYGFEWFKESLTSFNIPEDSTLKSAKRILSFLKFFGLIKTTIFISRLLKTHTPIVLVGRKTK